MTTIKLSELMRYTREAVFLWMLVCCSWMSVSLNLKNISQIEVERSPRKINILPRIKIYNYYWECFNWVVSTFCIHPKFTHLNNDLASENLLVALQWCILVQMVLNMSLKCDMLQARLVCSFLLFLLQRVCECMCPCCKCWRE